MEQLIEDIRAFEASYDDNKPHAVGRAEVIRNEGWDHVRHGDVRLGIQELGMSVRMLTDGQDFGEVVYPGYERELFATRSRLAQACFVLGKADVLLHLRDAIDRTPPELPVLDEEGLLDYRPDQYEIIFGGRLGLIAAAAHMNDGFSIAWRQAARARMLYGLSENRDRVVLADKRMNAEQRADTVEKFRKVAWAASAAPLMPHSQRKKLALKVCAK